ncbi:MAG: flagellar hook-basal body complex protein FliE [Candidatus Adiutrix sp.]|jgi:flagellar hook-basal body complex protein FliE|nr:flagellar hook-basal body complex protein FliE [Candidatus Adiutrix sp.]
MIRPPSLKGVSLPDMEMMKPTSRTEAAPGFADHLKASLMTTNALQNRADDAKVELATGRNGNIHETLLAINKAGVSFQMIHQVRNKIITAYQEVMRMQA